MLPSIDISARSIARTLSTNSAGLAQSLLRLSSGKRIVDPIDDIVSYTRSQNYRFQYTIYSGIKRDLDEWDGLLERASKAAGEVESALNRMMELRTMAGKQSDPAIRDAYNEEFEHLSSVIESVIGSTVSGSYRLLDTEGVLARITVSNSGTDSDKLSLTLGQIIVEQPNGVQHLSALRSARIGASADLTAAQSALDDTKRDVNGYLSRLSASRRTVQAFSNMAEAAMSNARSAESILSGVNAAEEALAFTRRDVCQQASLAMLAQAHLSYRNVLILYGLEGSR